MGDAQFLNAPFLSWIIMSHQAILVDRRDADSRDKVKQQIESRAKDDEQRYPPTMLFPEATVSNGSCLLTFKSGAFAPGAPVQPVILRYPPRKCFTPLCGTPFEVRTVPSPPPTNQPTST